MIKLSLCLLFAFLLVLPTALATTQNIVYDVEEDVLVSHTIRTNVSEPKLWVEEDAYNFEVLSDGEDVGFQLERTEGFKLVRPDVDGTEKEIEVEYMTSQVLERGENSYFITSLRTGQETVSVSVELKLPERALLKGEGMEGSFINPRPRSIETEGRRISVIWELEDLEEDEQVPFFVAYEEPSNIWFPFSLVSLVIIVLLVAAFFYQRRRGKQKKFDKRFQHLVEKEREVVDALMEKDDYTMWQKELQNATGFTKSKLSRTLKRMEERGIVDKMPYGTSNKVKLVEEKE